MVGFPLLFSLFLSVAVSKQQSDQSECVQMWLKRRPELLDRFKPGQISWLCDRTEEWVTKALNPGKSFDDTLTPLQRNYLSQLRTCRGLDCFDNRTNLCSDHNCTGSKIYKDKPHRWEPKRLNPVRKPQINRENINFDDNDFTVVEDVKVEDLLKQNFTKGGVSQLHKRDLMAKICSQVLNATKHDGKHFGDKNNNDTRAQRNKFNRYKTKCTKIVEELAKRHQTVDDWLIKPNENVSANNQTDGEKKMNLAKLCLKVINSQNGSEAFADVNVDDRVKQQQFRNWKRKCLEIQERLELQNITLYHWLNENQTDVSSGTDLPNESDASDKQKLDKRPEAVLVGNQTEHQKGNGKHKGNEKQSIEKEKNKDKKKGEKIPKSRQKRQTGEIPDVADLNTFIDANLQPSADVPADADFRARRKEYRMLSYTERQKLHAALNKLKSDKIDGTPKFDLLVVYHIPEEAPGAHWGPAFLPFHRELLKQVEVALRNVDPTVALPYWDSTLDEGLPTPKDSILWIPEFLGNGDKYVVSGPFANWSTTAELTALNDGKKKLYRDVGSSPFGGLYKESDVDFVVARKNYSELTACVDPTFELTHGVVHMFVGGYMADIGISPNDPTFFFHHSFVDFLFEEFRQTVQTRNRRDAEYPGSEKSCSSLHYPTARMKPFPIRNIDGLSHNYTDTLYHYDPRPTCSQANPDCGSPYIFCSPKYRCLSKVQAGGNCKSFEGTQICYNGSCKAGKCVANLPQTVAESIATEQTVTATQFFATTTDQTAEATSKLPDSTVSTSITKQTWSTNFTVEATTTYTDIDTTETVLATSSVTSINKADTTTPITVTVTTELVPLTTTQSTTEFTTATATTNNLNVNISTTIAPTQLSETTTTAIVTVTTVLPTDSNTFTSANPISPTATTTPANRSTAVFVQKTEGTTPTNTLPATTSTPLQISQEPNTNSATTLLPSTVAATDPQTTSIIVITATVPSSQPTFSATTSETDTSSVSIQTLTALTTDTTTTPIITSLPTTLPTAPITISSTYQPTRETLPPSIFNRIPNAPGIDADAVLPSVWFPFTIQRGQGYYKGSVPGAKITCSGQNVPPGYTSEETCKIWPNSKFPGYTGATLCPARDPSLSYGNLTVVQVEVHDGSGRFCKPTCLTPSGIYSSCSGRVRLSPNKFYSDLSTFRSNAESALTATWATDSGAVRQHLQDYLVFQCS